MRAYNVKFESRQHFEDKRDEHIHIVKSMMMVNDVHRLNKHNEKNTIMNIELNSLGSKLKRHLFSVTDRKLPEQLLLRESL